MLDIGYVADIGHLCSLFEANVDDRRIDFSAWLTPDLFRLRIRHRQLVVFLESGSPDALSFHRSNSRSASSTSK